MVDPTYGAEQWEAVEARNPRQPFEGKKILYVTPRDPKYDPVKVSSAVLIGCPG